MTTWELTVKSELNEYEERVTLKFNIASLALSLSFDVTLKLLDLFTGVWQRRKRKKYYYSVLV